MLKVTPIPAFNDNYIWLVSDNQSHHFVVDPGDADAVIAHLKQQQIALTGILITHHHFDHTGGIEKLQKHFNQALLVYGPDNENITGLTHPISSKIKQIELPLTRKPVEILHLPGHTLGHIAYQIESHLFCGDTLFNAGCGRLFEGTPEQMLASLNRIAALDDNTLLYPAHEYTLANLKFALTVEPDNQNLHKYHQDALQLRAQNRPTLPTMLGQQKAINPFLRSDSPSIWQHTASHFQQPIQDGQTCFTLLRQWKDNF
ncbi:hydroxyacylglutathione hydrolase [Shewanella sp. AS1]|uniref:hydroxyacylglutathione hydrolase n=1 Tax=Shewanella sp. AS1 TaxID=2907626 RepID=UPI001F2C4CF0|nr:hydroxyacylglutathione hydrolase [Shewanella sp. AS1]MCE9678813.1 hydroxyacylglutathione hydrolase [Shewanella sp. AS1]